MAATCSSLSKDGAAKPKRHLRPLGFRPEAYREAFGHGFAYSTVVATFRRAIRTRQGEGLGQGGRRSGNSTEPAASSHQAAAASWTGPASQTTVRSRSRDRSVDVRLPGGTGAGRLGFPGLVSPGGCRNPARRLPGDLLEASIAKAVLVTAVQGERGWRGGAMRRWAGK